MRWVPGQLRSAWGGNQFGRFRDRSASPARGRRHWGGAAAEPSPTAATGEAALRSHRPQMARLDVEDVGWGAFHEANVGHGRYSDTENTVPMLGCLWSRFRTHPASLLPQVGTRLHCPAFVRLARPHLPARVCLTVCARPPERACPLMVAHVCSPTELTRSLGSSKSASACPPCECKPSERPARIFPTRILPAPAARLCT